DVDADGSEGELGLPVGPAVSAQHAADDEEQVRDRHAGRSRSRDAAARSRNQAPSRASWSGSSRGLRGPSSARAITLAFSAPVAITTIARAAAMTAGVMVRRRGGGLGAFSTASTLRSLS